MGGLFKIRDGLGQVLIRSLVPVVASLEIVFVGLGSDRRITGQPLFLLRRQVDPDLVHDGG